MDDSRSAAALRRCLVSPDSCHCPVTSPPAARHPPPRPRARRPAHVALGAVLLGLAASTKNEGLTLIAAAAIALLFSGRRRDILRLWPAIVIPLPWLIARSLHKLPMDIVAGSVFDRITAHVTN